VFVEFYAQSVCWSRLKKCLTQWKRYRCLHWEVYRNTLTICSWSLRLLLGDALSHLSVFNLDDVAHISLSAFHHFIDVLSFLSASRCYSPSYIQIWPLASLITRFAVFVVLYIVQTPIHVHTIKTLFLLLNSLLHILIPPTYLSRFTLASFRWHLVQEYERTQWLCFRF
jgi:hypothetical protein